MHIIAGFVKKYTTIVSLFNYEIMREPFKRDICVTVDKSQMNEPAVLTLDFIRKVNRAL